jgi:hypothetical protein
MGEEWYNMKFGSPDWWDSRNRSMYPGLNGTLYTRDWNKFLDINPQKPVS